MANLIRRNQGQEIAQSGATWDPFRIMRRLLDRVEDAASGEVKVREMTAPAPQAEVVTAAGSHRFRPIADELRELEITRIREALEATAGNQTRAAALIAMPVRTFFEKAKQYGLTPKKKRYDH